jgi:trans-aconitate methyltransferase
VTLRRGYFEDLYAGDDDPWSFRTRWYETRKRRLTMATLPDEHYGSVFEPGCSIGVLSAELADRCDHLLAMDISAQALQQAKAELPPRVELRQGGVPSDWPAGDFDLIVLSEIGYYLDDEDCRRLAELAVTSARDVIAVHWRHPVDDYPLTGDAVHRVINHLAQAHGLAGVASHIEEDLRIDVWSSNHRSVAARTGLLPS